LDESEFYRQRHILDGVICYDGTYCDTSR